ncbi:MAG TPA: hypoxanthine phosphoribosyltransferase [Anaeromyxobacteraceae bacterium]|nr:hypoxanthine phosphoribosyltransferase [Anaeromyxobacteraceae bacterium]
MSKLEGEKLEVLLSEEQLEARVLEMGAAITRDYAHKPLKLVGVLKGSFVFMADLARAIDLPVKIDFIGTSSYAGTSTSGVVRITSDLSRPIEGEHVLLVEDIVDTGLTMKYLLENLDTRKPASVKICALLEKPARARTKVAIDYKGFEIPDVFVVGYGLDWDGRLRNLPYIAVVRS